MILLGAMATPGRAQQDTATVELDRENEGEGTTEDQKWEPSRERSAELLRGAIDLHIHSGPAPFPRPYDDIEIAQLARDAGMRAVVLKDHHMSTTARAYYAMKAVPGVTVCGSVCLNDYEGGLNPYIIDSELHYGLKVVWLPTVSAANHIGKFGGPTITGHNTLFRLKTEGINIIDTEGRLKKEMYAILELIAAADLLLATGHISEQEVTALLPEAFRVGVRKLVITHVNASIIEPSLETQKAWAEQGAFLEYVYVPFTAFWSAMPAVVLRTSPTVREVFRWIREVGPNRIVLATDLPTFYTCNPPEGLRIFMATLLSLGLPLREVELMVKQNPAVLLGL